MQTQPKTLGESIRRFLSIVKGCGFHFVVPSIRSFDDLDSQLARFDSEIEKIKEQTKRALAANIFMSKLESKLIKMEKTLRKRHRKRLSRKNRNKSNHDNDLQIKTEQIEIVSKVDEPEDTILVVDEVLITPTPSPLPIPEIVVEQEKNGEFLEEVSVTEHKILLKTLDSLIARKKFAKAESLRSRLSKIKIKPDVVLESDELSVISAVEARKGTTFHSDISRVQFVDLYMKGAKYPPASVPIHLELLDGCSLSPDEVYARFEIEVNSRRIYTLVGDRAYLFSVGEAHVEPEICNQQREMFITVVEKFLKANRQKKTLELSDDLRIFVKYFLPLWFKFFDDWLEARGTPQGKLR